MANGESKRLAMLIDVDSASATIIKDLLEEAAKYGAVALHDLVDWHHSITSVPATMESLPGPRR